MSHLFLFRLIMFTIIALINRFLMSITIEWCSNYSYLMVTSWIIFGLITYFVILKSVKSFFRYKNCTKVVNKICNDIENNDIISCVRRLEKYPQCINCYSDTGYTPFQVACALGNTQIVKLMLSKGADVVLKSRNNESPFYLATFHYIKYPKLKNASCIRELYYAGANINEPNDKGLTPLQMASMFGHTSLVRWLLMKNASRNVTPDPFLIANSQGFQDTAAVIQNMTKRFQIEFK